MTETEEKLVDIIHNLSGKIGDCSKQDNKSLLAQRSLIRENEILRKKVNDLEEEIATLFKQKNKMKCCQNCGNYSEWESGKKHCVCELIGECKDYDCWKPKN